LRAGRYVVIGELGAGSQAETLDAVDKVGGRAVAIKRFQVRGAKSWKDVELAEREARVLSTLSHPNLPVYIEHFEEDGALYLVMEKIEGETLAALRKRRSLLASQDIARFLSDAEGVLRYLHSRAPAIIHRDIKPGNVIRRADGSHAFVDFGSVRDQLKPEGGSTVVGTFGYMAPEQFQGRALPGSDVYAVAATALALVTGREPEDLPHRGLAIDVPAALGPGAEPWLVRALGAMLEPDPDKRPASVTVPRAHTDTAEARRESRRERHERVRSERVKFEREPNAWQSADPWNLNELHAEHFAQRQRMKAEGRRIRREIKEQVRDQTRRIKREARDMQRRYGGRPHPHGFGPAGPLLILVVFFALLAARVGTFALFRVFLPILLGFLAIFFGPGLRRAAMRVREVGEQGDRGIRHAMDAVRGRILGRPRPIEVEVEGEEVDPLSEREPSAESAPRTRVSDARVRVEPITVEADELADDEGEPEAKRQRS
jgi:tRNA A-37 threonylcarbamoyl transferase component Bud32